jgi:NitT/TauT family transport system substrate-binding protein
MRRINRIIAVASVAALAGGFAASASAQTKIRVGFSVIPIHLAAMIFQGSGATVHQGKSHNTEMIHFRGSAAQLTALAAGELDLAVLAFSTFGGGIVNARQDLVALADVARDGPQFSNVFGVLENSPIKSVKDLKGKVLAINGKGGAVDIAARMVMLRNGLKPGRDVTIVEARFGAMEAMLRQGKTDVSVFVAPFWARAKGKGGVRPLFVQKDGLGDTQFLLYAAKRDWVQNNRAVLVDWMEDYLRGTAWALDPKNRDAVLDISAKLTKRNKNAFASWAFTKDGDVYHDPKGRLDVPVLQKNIDVLQEFGILRRTFDVKKHVDESLVIEAASRLN